MKLLSRQIARRFQVSPDSVHPMFAGLSAEQLEELGELFVDAESLDEIRGWAEEKRLAKAQQGLYNLSVAIWCDYIITFENSELGYQRKAG